MSQHIILILQAVACGEARLNLGDSRKLLAGIFASTANAVV